MFPIFKFIYYQIYKQDKYFNKNIGSFSSSTVTNSSCLVTLTNHVHISSAQSTNNIDTAPVVTVCKVEGDALCVDRRWSSESEAF